MKTPREVYAAYNIMPSLQMHQLRVAAVGKMICDNFNGQVSERDVVLACLFHDMGNIAKFDLTLYPDLLKPEGREYWKRVQNDFIKKYGTSAHTASVAIAREIGLSDSVALIIERIGFSEMEHTATGNSNEQRVAQYADCRVSTHGVVSVKERLDDAVSRYAHRYQTTGDATVAYALYTNQGIEIERRIFSSTSIAPEDINDASIAPLIEELLSYKVD